MFMFGKVDRPRSADGPGQLEKLGTGYETGSITELDSDLRKIS